EADVRQNKVLAMLSYFPLLVFVPIFACVNSRFARRHANQGLVLLLINALSWISVGVGYYVTLENEVGSLIIRSVFALFQLALFVALLVQIFNCLNGKYTDIPLIDKITLLR
ncbi:MAG: hypothetical protein LBF58_06055, partial [Deltaproteobacteria bacterium]|nr:hypothetical protein [Deltaproteobacteria bacterium]